MSIRPALSFSALVLLIAGPLHAQDRASPSSALVQIDDDAGSATLTVADVLAADGPVVVPNDRSIPPGDVVVDPRAHLLYLGLDDGDMRVFPVAVGKRGSSWHGVARVERKVVAPTWHPTAHMRRKRHLPAVVRPGRSNPLGPRALYLFRGGRDTLYRIHGNNEPRSIGRSVSSGCIRMRNDDVKELFDLVPMGAVVTVL